MNKAVMDIYTEIIVALNDPKRKEAMTKELLENARIIEDENGEKQSICSIDGFYVDGRFFTLGRNLNNLKKVSLLDDDIILATSPKTGSHWLSNILTFLCADGDLDDKPTVQVFNLEFGIMKDLDAIPSPRVLHTHMKPHLLPNDAFKKGRKIVLVFRNPRDTAVSMYHFIKKESEGWEDLKVSWNSFLQHWLKESWLCFNFFDFYNEWQQRIQDDKDLSVYIAFFEDMRRDGLGELRKLQKYLGLNHSDEMLQRVLEKCSLKNLKTEIDERKSVSPFFIETVHPVLYRKGEVGGWKTYFTVAQSEQMDAIIEEKFEHSIFKERCLI